MPNSNAGLSLKIANMSKSPDLILVARRTAFIPMAAGSILFFFTVFAIERFGGPGLADLAAVFLAATLSSIVGFAFSAICGAMLFHLLDRPVQIIQIMIVCSIAIQILSVATLRNAIDWRSLSRFTYGGIIGLPIGVYLLTHLSPNFYLKCIGLFLVGYGMFMMLRPVPKVTFDNAAGDYIVGFLGGVTGGFAAFPGAFVTIWCGLKGWAKDRQRGAYQPFILLMQVLALVLISLVPSLHKQAGGIFDISTVSYIPGALLGTWCGLAIFRRLTDSQFGRIVNVLMIVSGIGLLA